MFSIELDCAPMTPRPSTLLPGVLKGTGIKLDPEKPSGTFFGNWTWDIPADQCEAYEKVRSTIAERVKALYHSGHIRYGSW